MSNTEIKALRTLVMVRKRQGERLEEALKAQRQALADAEAARAQAEEHRETCVQRHQEAEQDRLALTSGVFTPAALRAQDFRIQDLASAIVQAAQALQQQDAQVNRQREQVDAVQAAIRRNNQRIEGFENRIAVLRSLREQAAEELAEEETEETAVAKLCMRRRNREQAEA
ncbi:hypothetical protein [Caldimonas brevitalea]|uniref:Type III secretion protein n=1 Tax=Caldimonas brevitalea TaxID=413882 RepID=A0A0G3BIN0_9BURK|nr:hypothetical protein [Caldimonas brevitalea]AKJ27823.1 hypothetical protein AAW51_1132 [Caldimonas brevitalea]